MKEEIKKTRDELKKVREQIKNKSVKLNVFFEEDVEMIPINYDWRKWGEIEIKELDIKNPDSTITAIRAKRGSSMPDHYHLQQESIYVVSGLILENNTGNSFNAGEVLNIEPKLLHSIQFIEDSVLIVKWTPKLEY